MQTSASMVNVQVRFKNHSLCRNFITSISKNFIGGITVNFQFLNCLGRKVGLSLEKTSKLFDSVAKKWHNVDQVIKRFQSKYLYSGLASYTVPYENFHNNFYLTVFRKRGKASIPSVIWSFYIFVFDLLMGLWFFKQRHKKSVLVILFIITSNSGLF